MGSKPVDASRRGFTLIEMLVVLAVLAVLTSLGWPAVRNMLGRSEFRNAAKQVRVAMIQARLAAIESAAPRKLRYRPGTGKYEVAPLQTALDSPRPTPGRTSRNPASHDEPIQGALPAGVTFQEAAARTSGRSTAGEANSRDVGQTAEPPAVESERSDDAGWSPPILFFPDGKSSSARVRLAGPRGLWVEVTLRGLTGATRIGPIQRREESP
jgi:prepilin-type N-terminal cleavage/methylation domain-containing protein